MSDEHEYEPFEGPMLEMGEEFALEVLEQRWGHPTQWPSPCERPPFWHQRRLRKRERDLVAGIKEATGLTKITLEMRKKYWRELRKGQDVYEDAGGFFWRAYAVMLGFRSAEPVYGYSEAAADLLKGKSND